MKYCRCGRPIRDTSPYAVLCKVCLRDTKKTHGKNLQNSDSLPGNPMTALTYLALAGKTPPKEEAWKKRLYRG